MSQTNQFNAPTRKTHILPGWDDNNIIQIGIIALPAGANEIDTSLTLERDTVYTCLFSRTWESVATNSRDEI